MVAIASPSLKPRLIRLHPRDNVAIVANDGGLPAGTEVEGVVLTERVPQGHKVLLAPLAEGGEVLRYGVVIGRAARDLSAGCWVHERVMHMPAARSLEGLPQADAPRPELPPLEGHTFQGFRNPDGSVGTRNILAITETVQCVAGVVDHAVQRIRNESPVLKALEDEGKIRIVGALYDTSNGKVMWY